MKSPLIWLTGIPGSGKTTLAIELKKYYEQKGLPVENIGIVRILPYSNIEKLKNHLDDIITH